MAEIKEVMTEHKKDESRRVAQHKLAYEFVELIHGLGEAQKAEQQHRQLFSRDLSIKDLRTIEEQSSQNQAPPGSSEVTGAVPTYSSDINPSLNKYAPQTNAENMGAMRMKLPESLVRMQPMSKILWSAGLTASRSEAQRLINNGGAHIGSQSDRTGRMGDALSFAPITTWKPEDTERYVIDGNLLILRVGKWKIKIIDIVSDDVFKSMGLSCPGWKENEEEQAGKFDYKVEQQKRAEFMTQKRAERNGREAR